MTRPGIRAAAGLAGLAMLLTMACAALADSTDTRRARVSAALERYNALADLQLPVPPPDQIGEILAGRVVKLREHKDMLSPTTNTYDQRIRIVGYRLIERPRLLVWLAALDVGTEHSERLTEHALSADDRGGSVWYQHLHLPWPLRNRHWTIANAKSVHLTEATRGMVWEHAWQLAPRGDTIANDLLAQNTVAGLSGNRALRAIYLPANRGAWTMFALDKQLTLVAAHATVELGGIIPDRLVASFVSRQLQSMLNGLVARSDVMDAEYDTSYIIYTGAGEAITRAMAEQAMRAYRKTTAAEADVETRTGGGR